MLIETFHPNIISKALPVSLILTAFGFLGIVVALILEFSSDLPHFPFWLIMCFSIGAILLLMAYHLLIGIFSR